MNSSDKESRRLPRPKRQLRNIELRHSDGCIIATIEDRGYIYARTYLGSSFEDNSGSELSDAEIIKHVRRVQPQALLAEAVQVGRRGVELNRLRVLVVIAQLQALAPQALLREVHRAAGRLAALGARGAAIREVCVVEN